MNEAGAALARRLRRQGRWCSELGSPLYALLLEEAARDVEAGGACVDVLRGHHTDPPGSALALRLLGAVHRLVLAGEAPELAAFYPSAGGRGDPAGAWQPFRTLVRERRAQLRELLLHPVQTNEVGRSAGLIGGFLLVARATGLPLRVLELGASAGLNLRFDHYRYEAEEGVWGDPASPVRLVDRFSGAPPFDVELTVAERAGCDRSPLDPTSTEGALTLRAYVWPDQQERLALLQGALEVAPRVPAPVERAHAPEWLEERLATPTPGLATVVVHSAFLQYLVPEARRRLDAVLAAAGARATAEAPLARLAMEPSERLLDVTLTCWPGGAASVVAKAGAHGRSVRWLG